MADHYKWSAYSGTISYVRTPAIAATIAVATAVALLATAIADGE